MTALRTSTDQHRSAVARPADQLGQSAGEGLEQVAEVPGVLRNPGAGVAVPRAGAAAIVALDRPDRQEIHAVSLREVQHCLSVGQVRDLGLLRVIVNPRQHGHRFGVPDLRRGQVREDAGQLGMGVVRGVDGRLAHVHHALAGYVVVEHHDVDGVHRRTVGDGVLQHGLAVRVEPVLLDRDRVLDLQRDTVRRRPLFGQRDCLVAPINAGRVLSDLASTSISRRVTPSVVITDSVRGRRSR